MEGRSRIITFVTCTFLFSLLSAFSITPAQAQEENSQPAITISPSIIDLDVKPDQVTIQTINIKNNTDFTLPVKIEVMDYSVNDDGSPDYTEDLTEWSPKGWITAEPADMLVEPYASREVSLTISIPEKARPGSHLATIMFKPVLPEDYFEPHSAHIIPYLGAIASLNVITDDYEQPQNYLELQAFTSKSSDDSEPVEFASSLMNSDAYYHKVEGIISISNILGNEVKTVKIDNTTILPSKIRNLKQEIEEGLFFGKYTAKMTIEDENSSLTGTTDFWVTPSLRSISLIALSILAILIIFGGVIFLFKNRKNLKKALRVLLKKQ